MVTREELTQDLVIDSLHSLTCPCCAGPKKWRKSLCWNCWGKLPGTTKQALYRRVGDGYEDALHEALNFLQAETFHQGK